MNLSDPVESLKGVGKVTSEVLRKAGIKTVRDFFYNLPRDYLNFQRPTSISEIRPGRVVIKGRVDKISTRPARRRHLTITEAVISDKTGAVKATWFNQSYREKQFDKDRDYYFTGTYELRNGRWGLTSPSAALVTDIDPQTALRPVYVAHGAITSQKFHDLVNNSRDKFQEIPDLLPTVRPGVRKDALYNTHFPTSDRALARAREYLAYEELFELILAAKLNRRENEKLRATPIPFQAEKIRDFVGRLPFALTDAQRKAAWEIFQNMELFTPMNRLLQGDVGSGKTVVAAMSAYATVLAGRQAAILAPTAILAEQHFKSINGLLEPFGVRTALLTGATKKKPELKYKIYSGEIDLVIGTHALLTDDTEFRDLALVVIDEQHRFGVEQRQKLVLKSPERTAPHLLAMTATPIPRSLQLTVFGDLNVSILNQMPKGRQPVKTTILTEVEMREKLYPKITEILAAKPDEKAGHEACGQQVYWICKAIETDVTGASDVTSVKARAKKLQALFPDFTIEILHGKMKPDEKDAVMARFAAGEIQILVSTTVVEVGVDVPNASLIVIENAERYGLAQLHQLRGRVGRGSSAAFCYLLTAGDTPPSRRLKELERSNDGFHLAEVDLEMRGPGEIYGALQHGALDLRIATLSDTALIHRAQEDVERFLATEPDLVEFPELMNGIFKYQQLTTLN